MISLVGLTVTAVLIVAGSLLTLRGLLLNAYAFGTMTIAGIAAIEAFLGAVVMLVLSGLRLWHGRRGPDAYPGSTASVAVPPIPAGAY